MMSFITSLLVFVLKALRILPKKVLFSNKINDIAYTTKESLFWVKIKQFREFYKSSIIIRGIIKNKETKVLSSNIKS